MILDPDACFHDAGFFRVGRTDKPILGVGFRIYVSMMRVSIMCIHEACSQDACIHDESMMHLHKMHVRMMHVCMMHVCRMHISMTLDLDACVYDAYIFDP